MKIYFNHNKIEKTSISLCSNILTKRKDSSKSNTEYSVLPNTMYLANLPNINFKGGKQLLHRQAEHFKCAYTGLPLLPKKEYLQLSEKLLKRPNTQSSIKLLENYQPYMGEVEEYAFETFKENKYKCKKSFQDILIDLVPEALPRLKEKQLQVLDGSQYIIRHMTEDTAAQINGIIEECKKRIDDDTFRRQYPLDELDKVGYGTFERGYIELLYKNWYQGLPSTSDNFDAFVVKYARKDHNCIANRLVSTAVATIDDITPLSKIKEECEEKGEAVAIGVENYLLVRAGINHTRHNLPFMKFIWLNDKIDIPENLEKYVKTANRLANNPNSELSNEPEYANKIVQRIEKETNGGINLENIIKKSH